MYKLISKRNSAEGDNRFFLSCLKKHLMSLCAYEGAKWKPHPCPLPPLTGVRLIELESVMFAFKTKPVLWSLFNFVTFLLGYFSVQLDTQDGTLLVDYSKNIITEETMKLLMNLVCQWNGYKDIRFLFFSVKEWALKKSSVVFLNWKR